MSILTGNEPRLSGEKHADDRTEEIMNDLPGFIERAEATRQVVIFLLNKCLEAEIITIQEAGELMRGLLAIGVNNNG